MVGRLNLRRTLSILGTSFTVLFTLPAAAKFLPDNNLYLQDHRERRGGITEDDFNEVIDRAVEFYEGVISDHGGSLTINRLWTDSTVNASAQRFLDEWVVNMYGGLARRPEITKDGFYMVVCHELGHHLAGYPFVSGWASDEGNSDYFASLSCGRQLWGNDLDENAEAGAEVPDYPKNLCDDAFYGEGVDRLNLCYRQMLASYSIAHLLGTLGGTQVTWDQPDKSQVSRTDHAHPEGQCRLDTYMAGTLCQADFDYQLIPKSERSAASQSCHSANGDTDYLRPRCWFKPGI